MLSGLWLTLTLEGNSALAGEADVFTFAQMSWVRFQQDNRWKAITVVFKKRRRKKEKKKTSHNFSVTQQRNCQGFLKILLPSHSSLISLLLISGCFLYPVWDGEMWGFCHFLLLKHAQPTRSRPAVAPPTGSGRHGADAFCKFCKSSGCRTVGVRQFEASVKITNVLQPYYIITPLKCWWIHKPPFVM